MMDTELGRAAAPGGHAVFGPRVTVKAALDRDPAGPLASYDVAARAALAAMAGYVTQFLTSEHPDLGRPGAVCPFARQAADQDLIRLTACSTGDEAAIVEGLGRLRSELADIGAWPAPATGLAHRAIVAVFPCLFEPDGARMIDRMQKRLKPSFVEGRLMIGQFYPSCAEPGLWNRQFLPLQSPVISMAMRDMTVFDAHLT